MGFGGTISNEAPRIAGVSIQSSAFGLPIPVVLGTTRLPGNLLHYSDFKAIPHTQSQGSGGKGAPDVQNTTYSYTAALLIGLGEGPIVGIGKVWVGKEQQTLASLGFTLFDGSGSQATWGWMDTNHPTESLYHRRLAYLASAAYSLGSNAQIGNHGFEIRGALRLHNGTTQLDDCDPADMVEDLLTNAQYSVTSWPSGMLGSLTQFSNACRAYGILLSLGLSEQKPLAEVLNELVRTANAQPFFSEGKLKITPYADQAKTGNGVTFTPYLTAEYALGFDDFILKSEDEDPVRCTRGSSSDAYNQITVEFKDRANDYNLGVVEAKDQANIELFGSRPKDKLPLHLIQDKTVAQAVADQILRRSLYTRNVYEFTLGWEFADLEPMDIVTLTEPNMDLYALPVRILEIEEDEEGALTIKAEEVLNEVSTPATYGSQGSSGYIPNYNVAPGNVNAPLVFEPPIALAETPAVWVAVSGGVYWGGCDVWLSYDNITYTNVQRIVNPARTGALTATLASGTDPDAVNILSIDLSESRAQLLAATTADANALRTLCYVGGELVAYRDATLTGANAYDLGYLRRGAYNTPIASHAAGTRFARLDDAVVKIPYAVDQVGKTVYLKFVSFNLFGGATQDISALSPVTYVITGAAINTVANLALVQAFDNSYCSIKWDAVVGASGYEVKVKNGATVLRTIRTADTTYTYSFEDGTADGGPYRTVTFEVKAIGTTTVGGVATLSATNAVPAAPTLSLTPGPQNVVVATPPPTGVTDIAGMLVWASTTTGFTPGPGNLVYDGPGLAAVVPGSGGIPLFIRAALYDTFGKTGLNLTTEVTATPATLSADSIPVGSSLPGTGSIGQLYYLSTDDKMYRYGSTGWITWTDGSDILASSITAGKIGVTSLSSITANIGTITAGTMAAGTVFAGALSAATGTFAGSLSAATGTFAGSLSAATGTFAGSLSAATGTFAGSLSAATGSFGNVTAAGTITVSSTGAIALGQTAYNTGVGIWQGYSGGVYKMSMGDPSGSYLRWTGADLEVYGNIIDKRPFAAGTVAVASASTEIFMGASASTWTKVKAITCPRGGVLRCNWDAYAGTTGAQTKTKIYKNGTAVSSDFTHTTIGWHSQTYDITFAAGDSIELWAWWQSTQGKVRNFVLTNTFNENFFVVTLDS